MRSEARNEVVESMTRYEVQARPVGRFWHVEVPSLDAATQARNVDEIAFMATDLIEGMTDSKDFSITVRYSLPPEAEEHRIKAETLRREELRLRNEASVELRAAARTLRNEGLALRDVGALLGVSTQRAGQLLGPTD